MHRGKGMIVTDRVFAAAMTAVVSLAWMSNSSAGQDKIAASTASTSAGWPQWRGPNRDNVVADGTRVAIWGDAG